jgi:hypothetical protein
LPGLSDQLPILACAKRESRAQYDGAVARKKLIRG